MFQSTHPRRVRPLLGCFLSVVSGFNPRTHAGCDMTNVCLIIAKNGFNPRTHAGCDEYRIKYDKNFRVSIHAPTQGATGDKASTRNLSCVSIHAPTQGATRTADVYHRQGRVSIHAPTQGATLSVSSRNDAIASFNPRTHAGCDYRFIRQTGAY